MRFLVVCLTAAMAGVVVSAPAARAQDTQQATAPSARQLALTRRYVELMMSEQFEDVIRAMVAGEAALDREAQTLPEEDRRFLIDLTAELTADMIPQMLEEMIPIYARAYTEAELEALIAFYDSEMGRSIIAKTMEAMPTANQAAMSVLPQLMEKMAARLCQHYGCAPGELETLQRQMRGEVVVVPGAK